MPAAGVPCWLAKKLRPLPAHSMNDVVVVAGSFFRSSRLNCTARSSVGWLRSPDPNTFSRQLGPSTTGVPVWSRTKKRSFGVV